MAEFRALLPPTTTGAFRLGVELCPGCRIGKTGEGHLALLIDVARTGTSSPRRLENMSYDPPSPLEIHAADGSVRRQDLGVLLCRADDEALQAAFLRMALTLLDTTEAKLTESELDGRLDELVLLFRALSRPATQTIQGLWSELALIAWSAEPRLAVASWHSNARALHDFEALPDRLEVKSCSSGLREHEVRLEQLQDAPGGRTVLASLMVTEADDGVTVGDLCALVLTRVGQELEIKRRLETIVTRSLGRNWREAANRRYDLSQARRDLRLYDAAQVPSIRSPLPAELSFVRFVVDLSTTEALSARGGRALGSFFRRLLPPEI